MIKEKRHENSLHGTLTLQNEKAIYEIYSPKGDIILDPKGINHIF